MVILEARYSNKFAFENILLCLGRLRLRNFKILRPALMAVKNTETTGAWERSFHSVVKALSQRVVKLFLESYFELTIVKRLSS